MILFLLICSCITVATAAENETPIIGVVAQELEDTSLGKQYPAYSNFIAASYVKAAESSGARVVPIVINKNENYYRNLLKSINGIILPGGSSRNGPGNPYYDTVSHIYKISKEMNDAGKSFPILGVCLGYEFLITVANNDNNLLMNCTVNDENLPLKFTRSPNETNFFSRLTQQQHEILHSSNVTFNHHIWCALENDFVNASLSDWIITSTSTGSNGIDFIASVEHKKYPFFGIQFHPEKIAFEWNPSHNYVHSEEALIANRYFYDTLIHFAKQSANKFHSSKAENRALIYNYPTKIPENGFYQQVYLF